MMRPTMRIGRRVVGLSAMIGMSAGSCCRTRWTAISVQDERGLLSHLHRTVAFLAKKAKGFTTLHGGVALDL